MPHDGKIHVAVGRAHRKPKTVVIWDLHIPNVRTMR